MIDPYDLQLARDGARIRRRGLAGWHRKYGGRIMLDIVLDTELWEPQAAALSAIGLDELDCGSTRSAYRLADGLVLKLPDCYHGLLANQAEIEVWRGAPEHIRRHLAPIIAYDPDGWWLVMEEGTWPDSPAARADYKRRVREAQDAIEGHYPRGFLDFSDDNFAQLADGSAVSIDYPYTLSNERLRAAGDWRTMMLLIDQAEAKEAREIIERLVKNQAMRLGWREGDQLWWYDISWGAVERRVMARQSGLEHLGEGSYRIALQSPTGHVLKLSYQPGHEDQGEEELAAWNAAQGTLLASMMMPTLMAARGWSVMAASEGKPIKADAIATARAFQSEALQLRSHPILDRLSELDLSPFNWGTYQGSVRLMDYAQPDL